jgi:hypothetical protein
MTVLTQIIIIFFRFFILQTTYDNLLKNHHKSTMVSFRVTMRRSQVDIFLVVVVEDNLGKLLRCQFSHHFYEKNIM